jgi:hypothetical protein
MNPRDRRAGDRRPLGGAPRPSSAVWYVLGFLFLMALAQAWFLAPSGRQLPYSEFKQLVRSNQVAEVTVGEEFFGLDKTQYGLQTGSSSSGWQKEPRNRCSNGHD